MADFILDERVIIFLLEAFVGGYPKGLDFGVRLGTRSSDGRDEFRRYFEGAIEYGSAYSERIAKAAKTHNVHLVVGVVEREGGTLYCSVSTRLKSSYAVTFLRFLLDLLLRPGWQQIGQAQEANADGPGTCRLGLRRRVDTTGPADATGTH